MHEVLELAGGVPLLLSLASAQVGQPLSDELATDPDLIEAIVQRAVEREPSPAHARALAVSTLVSHTTEDLLAVTIEGESARAARDEVRYEALRRTYFEPGAKQRAVAADLNLGYSTYRRQLANTIERLTNVLFEREQDARAPREHKLPTN